MKHVAVLAIFGTFFLISCLKDKTVQPKSEPTGPSDPCSTTVSYTTDIRPIIESSCKTQAGPGTGCHDAWIDDFAPIESYINSGTWQNECWIENTMPVMPNTWGIDSLSEDEIQTMKCWINQGYPEN